MTKTFTSDRLFTKPAATEAPITADAEKVITTINDLAKKKITTFTPGTLLKHLEATTGATMTPEELAAIAGDLRNNPKYEGLINRLNETPKSDDPRINLRLTAENMAFLQSEKWHRRTTATQFINQIIEEYRINYNYED